MAREIHDDLGQSLAALKMNLTMITKTGTDPSIEPLLTDMREILDQTVRKVRALAQELRPPVLDTTGIIEALRWHAHEFAKSFNVETLFDCDLEELELGKSASLATFRIIQEALTNSVRHGNPKQIRIRVTLPREKELEVAVRDDGEGFAYEPDGVRAGFGLLSMRERAQQVGGELEVESAPGEGTTVRARIPVREFDD
jgi:signal transduction histidine kinase